MLTASLIAQVQRLALVCSAGDLAHGRQGPRVAVQPEWTRRRIARWCSRRAGRGGRAKLHAWPETGKRRFSRLGYQSRSRVVRLINMGLPGARRGGRKLGALWLARGLRSELRFQSMLLDNAIRMRMRVPGPNMLSAGIYSFQVRSCAAGKRLCASITGGRSAGHQSTLQLVTQEHSRARHGQSTCSQYSLAAGPLPALCKGHTTFFSCLVRCSAH